MHVLSALAPSITVLLAVRVLAGFATAACIVVGRAIVVDLFPGAAMTRAFATLGAVTAIVPVAAPVAGGVLALVMGWRGMFLVLAALALVITVVGWRALPESLPPERRTPPHLGSVLRGLWALLCLRTFLAYAAATGAVAGDPVRLHRRIVVRAAARFRALAATVRARLRRQLHRDLRGLAT